MTDSHTIKDKLDIVEFIGRTVPLKRAGRLYKACCPFHSEKTPSFYVDPDRQTWRCYGACAAGGDVFAFVQRRDGTDFYSALELLAKEAGVTLKGHNPQDAARRERLLGLLKAAANWYQANLAAAVEALHYLRGRGLRDATIREWRIGLAPQAWDGLTTYLRGLGASDADLLACGVAVKTQRGTLIDMLRNRIIFPIWSPRMEIVAFAGRALDANEPAKYLNTSATTLFAKDRTLYGLKRDVIRDSTAVVVEGYMDAIQAHQAGYTNVVAQMGTALTKHQVALLKPARRIVLALDGDAAGIAAARRDLEVAFRSGRDVYVATLPDGLDPDDLLRADPARWQGIVDEAEPLADFVIRVECAGISPTDSLPMREAAARQALPLLLSPSGAIYRLDNVFRLADRLGLDRDALLDLAHSPAGSRRSGEGQGEPPDAPAPPVLPAINNRQRALEVDVLQALLSAPQLWYQAGREFYALNMPFLDERDFPTLASLYMLLQQALEQDDHDPRAWLAARADDDIPFPLRPETSVSFDRLLIDILNLRIQGLTAQIEAQSQRLQDGQMTLEEARPVARMLALCRQRLTQVAQQGEKKRTAR